MLATPAEQEFAFAYSAEVPYRPRVAARGNEVAASAEAEHVDGWRPWHAGLATGDLENARAPDADTGSGEGGDYAVEDVAGEPVRICDSAGPTYAGHATSPRPFAASLEPTREHRAGRAFVHHPHAAQHRLDAGLASRPAASASTWKGYARAPLPRARRQHLDRRLHRRRRRRSRRRSSRARLGLDLIDLTGDGNTTEGVLADLAEAPAAADVVTLTAGGNDLLIGQPPDAILRRLEEIAARIKPLDARIVFNTVYDPSDGDDALGGASSASRSSRRSSCAGA